MLLSYTKLRTFGECALKYRLAYIERLPRPPIKALAFQRRIHTALGQYHLFARRDGTVHLEELLTTYDEVSGGPEHPEVRETPSYLDGVEILKRYHAREQHRDRVPAFIERSFKVEFGPHILTGTVDRLDFADADGYSLVDYKLDRKMPEGNTAAASLQLSFYHLLVYEGLGQAPDDVRLYYLRHGVEHVSTRSRGQMAATVAWVNEMAAGIGRERKWRPCEGHACRTCAFWSQCPAKTGKERTLDLVWRQSSMLDALIPARTSFTHARPRSTRMSSPAQMVLDLGV